MRSAIRFNHLLLAGTAAVMLAAGPVTDVVQAKPETPDVPSDIAVESGHEVFMVGHAVGVQIYSCNVTPTGFGWGLVAPRADLFNDKGKLIATHFAGPTWQAKDGSAVMAQRVNGVTVDTTAIPWLLLSATSTTVGPEGDQLTDTAFIQRTDTTGGLAPAPAGCNATTAGTTAEIPYTADYYFWKSEDN